MKTTEGLPTLLRGFFEDYLAGQRDVSRNTIMAYRDAFKLFLRFAAKRASRQVVRLRLEDLGPTMLLAFLDHLEHERQNSVATRNYRLVAIHRFFAYVADRDPLHAELCRRILEVPIKKTGTCPMTYLERDEIKTVLAAPDPSQPLGLRDRALLTFLYNTGARASEAAALEVRDLHLQTPAQVRLRGKGRKERLCPLWPETTNVLRTYLDSRGKADKLDQPLFLNAHGNRITRFGLGVIVSRHVKTATTAQPSLARKQITQRRCTSSKPALNSTSSGPGSDT
jgi:site-specific recombinase XerD